MNRDEPLARIAFAARIIEWRGPAPFLFAPLPEELTGEILFAARTASYGWGVVPVAAVIGQTAFTTSLIPRDGRFLLPIKLAVQRAETIGVGARIKSVVTIVSRAARSHQGQ
ncbi:MAG: DUF1905 domain-containing protein [Proteobacteria bacterium]|nr:DUF1905 domain-containing protein [Pseudomonadota bacterium]